jgi:tetratricopeptide (TPR) repeat protein
VLSQQMSRFVLRMPEGKVNRPGATTISIKQLLHPPTKRAFHSFAEAQKFSTAGDYSQATKALERALAESPDYGEAHINLGAQYARAGRLDDAAREFVRGLEILGPNPVALFDLASVEAKRGQLPRAVELARAGLKLDQASAQGHLVLGILLASDLGSKQEALVHLERAAETFASAREVMEKLRGQ